jgi:hypothetical protein
MARPKLPGRLLVVEEELRGQGRICSTANISSLVPLTHFTQWHCLVHNAELINRRPALAVGEHIGATSTPSDETPLAGRPG